MLAFRHRFHGHNSLRYVYKNGTAVRGQYMTIKYIHNPRRKTSRFAVIVSKKVLKSAVGRNRIRRRMYELIRDQLMDMKDSHDIVYIIASSDIRTMQAGELRDLFTSMTKDADLYK